MSFPSQSHVTQQEPSKARGSSCNHCRRRKLKCDGKRPICDVCRRSTLPLDDCEYPVGGHSRAHILQEKISILETRLGELETPTPPGSSVQLHNPYSQYSRGNTAPLATPRFKDSRVKKHLVRMMKMTTIERRRLFLDTFLSFAPEVGFFLDPVEFRSSFIDGSACKPLMSAALLLVAYVSREEQRETEYLSSTTESLASNSQFRFSPQNPPALISTIQVYVLLANYLFFKGKTLEGKYYANTALSLILGTGLHRTQHPDQLPPARDVPEWGERINAVWAVLSLNAAWKVAEENSSSACVGWNPSTWKVGVPWPLEIGQYNTISPNYLRGNHADTIQGFLENMEDNGYSTPALYAKACILFERATALYHRNQPNLSLAEAQQFRTSYESVSAVLSRFISKLRGLEPPNSKERAKRMFVIYLLTRVALVQLLYARGAHSQPQILPVLESIVGYIRSSRLDDFGVVDPLVATLLRVVGNVLLELLRASPSSDLSAGFDTIINAMMTLSKGTTGSMMETQASILRERRIAMFRTT
ncbi:hypothetical protein L218DRAFT_989984 [Marasmius fiardii PR-910]|nr:hypothetical protein L218DRAFT_989984 [Marasmius fiardii PR-910]